MGKNWTTTVGVTLVVTLNHKWVTKHRATTRVRPYEAQK